MSVLFSGSSSEVLVHGISCGYRAHYCFWMHSQRTRLSWRATSFFVVVIIVVFLLFLFVLFLFLWYLGSIPKVACTIIRTL